MPDPTRAEQLAADGDQVPEGVDPPTEHELAEAARLFKDLDANRS